MVLKLPLSDTVQIHKLHLHYREYFRNVFQEQAYTYFFFFSNHVNMVTDEFVFKCNTSYMIFIGWNSYFFFRKKQRQKVMNTITKSFIFYG